MLKEFRDFINKGNVVDLAVAVIMGAAFGAIVTSFIGDIITPLILSPVMKTMQVEELAKLTWNGVKYGNFLAAVLNFLVVAFVMFMMVRTMNRMNQKKEAAPSAPPADIVLLTEIRDLLKK